MEKGDIKSPEFRDSILMVGGQNFLRSIKTVPLFLKKPQTDSHDIGIVLGAAMG